MFVSGRKRNCCGLWISRNFCVNGHVKSHSLSSALLAIMACGLDHQNAVLIRRQKPKKEKTNTHKKANYLCTTFNAWLYTVEKPFSVKNGQNLVKRTPNRCHWGCSFVICRSWIKHIWIFTCLCLLTSHEPLLCTVGPYSRPYTSRHPCTSTAVLFCWSNSNCGKKITMCDHNAALTHYICIYDLSNILQKSLQNLIVENWEVMMVRQT